MEHLRQFTMMNPRLIYWLKVIMIITLEHISIECFEIFPHTRFPWLLEKENIKWYPLKERHIFTEHICEVAFTMISPMLWLFSPSRLKKRYFVYLTLNRFSNFFRIALYNRENDAGYLKIIVAKARSTKQKELQIRFELRFTKIDMSPCCLKTIASSNIPSNVMDHNTDHNHLILFNF